MQHETEASHATLKQLQREQIARDVEAFLQAGGQIKRASSEDNVNPNWSPRAMSAVQDR
jgi:metal-sulfur cluster biosynthetic enzyme